MRVCATNTAVDSERRRHASFQRVAVGVACRLLGDEPEHQIAEVGIALFAAGIELQRLADHEARDVPLRRRIAQAEPVGDLAHLEAGVEAGGLAVPAALVIEKLADRDGGEARVDRLAGQRRLIETEIGEHRRVERDGAPLHEGVDQRLGEGLAHAREAKRACSPGYGIVGLGPGVGPFEQHLALTRNRHGAGANAALLHESAHDRVDCVELLEAIPGDIPVTRRRRGRARAEAPTAAPHCR